MKATDKLLSRFERFMTSSLVALVMTIAVFCGALYHADNFLVLSYGGLTFIGMLLIAILAQHRRMVKNTPMMPYTKVIQFEGIPSGDGASFCWLVNAKTYERIMGRKPNQEFERGECWNTEEYKDEVLYRLYPMFRGEEKRQKYRFEFTENRES